MKRIAYSAVAIIMAFSAGAVVSAQVHDWHALDEVHKHVVESINEMEQARAAMRAHLVNAGHRLRRILSPD